MTELKACPFCGGRAIMQDRYIQAICNRKHYWVVCSVCESRIHDRKNMTRAITAWNTRAEPSNPPLTEAQIRERVGLEFRHNPPPSLCAEYEIVCWQGRTCYTVATFRYNEHEPCWYLESVGDRIAELDGNEFMREVNKGFAMLADHELKGD